MADIENDILSDADATLLLHIAGELGDAERQSIEARLTGDAAFRDRLGQLTRFDAMLQSETSVRAVPAADSRRILTGTLRMVREQALVLQSRPAMRIRHRRLAGIPRWAWASAAAACVAVGLVVWISNSDPGQISSPLSQTSGEDENGIQPRRGEIAAMAQAFGTVEPASSEGSGSEIDSQVYALNMLSAMNEPN
jgi:hypothetical protein